LLSNGLKSLQQSVQPPPQAEDIVSLQKDVIEWLQSALPILSVSYGLKHVENARSHLLQLVLSILQLPSITSPANHNTLADTISTVLSILESSYIASRAKPPDTKVSEQLTRDEGTGIEKLA
jgi:predicted AAA+ superfamily ATPase